MKKSVLLATAITAGLSAFAAAPMLPASALETSKFELAPVTASQAVRTPVAPKDVTEATKAIIKLPSNLFYAGLSPEQQGLRINLGSTSAYEPIVFKSASTGAVSLLWTYYNPWELEGEGEDRYYKEETSTADSVIYTAAYQLCAGPSLTAIGPNYLDKIDLELDVQYPSNILFGGTLEAAVGQPWGITPISRMRVENGFDKGYNFSNGHILGVNNKADSQVDEMWGGYLTDVYTEEDPTAVVTNVKYTGFGNIFPEPASPYIISNVWVWASAEFSGAGTLTLEVMTLTEDDQLDEVVASGTCDYTAETESGVFMFPLAKLDEFGFEIDEPVEISTRIAFVIRNLNENASTIVRLAPCWPMGYTYLTGPDARNPYRSEMYNINVINYEVDGVEYEGAFWSPWGYFADPAQTTLMAITSYAFFCDAMFGWCLPVGEKVSEPVVNRGIVLAGGEIKVDINSYFAIDTELNPESIRTDDEWLTYEIDEFDSETGSQTLTIYVDPADADRVGSIKVKALAARELEIKINQSNDYVAVESVGADAEVVASKYFDLQGRELTAQPESGIAIRKDIKADGSSTSVKVIR